MSCQPAARVSRPGYVIAAKVHGLVRSDVVDGSAANTLLPRPLRFRPIESCVNTSATRSNVTTVTYRCRQGGAELSEPVALAANAGTLLLPYCGNMSRLSFPPPSFLQSHGLGFPAEATRDA